MKEVDGKSTTQTLRRRRGEERGVECVDAVLVVRISYSLCHNDKQDWERVEGKATRQEG